MSYRALANQFRPPQLSSVVGQTHVTDALRYLLDSQKIHQSMVFMGTRGVGKTSLVRIIAKALNCQKGVSATPCGVCEHCVAIAANHHMDVIEVDGASKTKVEDTRDLLANLSYPPASARYRVVIIDEVHMLSTHSFNALLKTLEEPPPHLVFLLATTEVDKLPATILSRCLQFYLTPIADTLIESQLAHVLSSLSVECPAEVMHILVQAARGSLRDALTLTEQAIASSGGQLTLEAVARQLGFGYEVFMPELLNALASQDARAVIDCLNRAATAGVSASQWLGALQSLLYEMMCFHQTKVMADYVPQEATLLAEKIQPSTLTVWYQLAVKGAQWLKDAPRPMEGLTMVLLSWLSFQPGQSTQSRTRLPQERIPKPTNTQVSAVSTDTPSAPKMSASDEVPLAPQNNQSAERVQSVSHQVADKTQTNKTPALLTPEGWADVVPQLKLTGLAAMLTQNTSIQAIDGQQITLAVSEKQTPLLNDARRQQIEKAVNEWSGQRYRVLIEAKQGVLNTPAKQLSDKEAQSQADAKASIEADPLVQQLQKETKATILEIQPSTEH